MFLTNHNGSLLRQQPRAMTIGHSLREKEKILNLWVRPDPSKTELNKHCVDCWYNQQIYKSELNMECADKFGVNSMPASCMTKLKYELCQAL